MESSIQKFSFGGAEFCWNTEDLYYLARTNSRSPIRKDKTVIEAINFREGSVTVAYSREDGEIGVKTIPLRLALSSDSRDR